MMTKDQVHVVVGAGATGSATALLLAQAGNRVRVVTRSGTGPTHPDIELIAADASDSTSLESLTSDAGVLYNCANPPYHRWTTDWPPLSASLLRAASANDAVLVTLSNLYGYAAPTAPMKESDPLDPPSIKGGVRAAMWNEALAAHEAGRVRAVEARASDFIGPGLGANGHMGDRIVPRLLVGKPASVLGRADVDHSWTAISDVARTLVTIGREEQAWGRAWHVPTTPPITQQQLIHRMCDLAGVNPVKVKTMPSMALRLGGVFSSQIRELGEIAYQFERPFVIDSSSFTAQFGVEPTPLDETLRATLDSYGNASVSTPRTAPA